MASGTIEKPLQIHFKEVSATTDNSGNLFLNLPNSANVVSCRSKTGTNYMFIPFFSGQQYAKVLNWTSSSYQVVINTSITVIVGYVL